jgi:hypothetical protein
MAGWIKTVKRSYERDGHMLTALLQQSIRDQETIDGWIPDEL